MKELDITVRAATQQASTFNAPASRSIQHQSDPNEDLERQPLKRGEDGEYDETRGMAERQILDL
jgi:hypothetical protein